MATMTETAAAGPSFQPIIDNMANEDYGTDDFNASKHLSYKHPEQIISMRDIGFPEDRGISPMAVSQPFPLFSKEAIGRMRGEIFKAPVMENCKFTSDLAACQLRGYSQK